MMCTDIIVRQVNRTAAPVNFDVYRFEKCHAFPLPLPFITGPIDFARTGVKGGEEIKRTSPACTHAPRGWAGCGAGMARWSTVVTVPASAALWRTAPCTRTTCDHVLWRSPRETVD